MGGRSWEGGPPAHLRVRASRVSGSSFKLRLVFFPSHGGPEGGGGGPPLLLLVAMGKLDAVPRDLDSDSLTPARGARLYTRRGGGFSSPGLLS